MANSVQILGGVCKHGLVTTTGIVIIETGDGDVLVYCKNVFPL